MRDFMAITRALADVNRVRILMALRPGELCVCQVIELLELAPSTVSKHIFLLCTARLLEGRKQGRWMYYRLADPRAADASRPAARALKWVAEALAADPRILADDERLRMILQDEPEVLCRRQSQRSKCCSSAPATPVAARWPKGGPAISRAAPSRPTRRASSPTA